MSGVRGVGMPAYSHIKPRQCPVCGKEVLNFEAHTRKEGHALLRILQQVAFSELVRLYCEKYRDIPIDSGIATSMNQRAWDMAIERWKP